MKEDLHDIFFPDISQIFLEEKKKKKCRSTSGIFRTQMHFLQVNVTFYDAVNIIHDVLRTSYPFPYSCLSVLEIIKLNKSDVEKCICISVAIYKKYLNPARKLSILSLDIFDIRQYYTRVHILYLSNKTRAL